MGTPPKSPVEVVDLTESPPVKRRKWDVRKATNHLTATTSARTSNATEASVKKKPSRWGPRHPRPVQDNGNVARTGNDKNGISNARNRQSTTANNDPKQGQGANDSNPSHWTDSELWKMWSDPTEVTVSHTLLDRCYTKLRLVSGENISHERLCQISRLCQQNKAPLQKQLMTWCRDLRAGNWLKVTSAGLFLVLPVEVKETHRLQFLQLKNLFVNHNKHGFDDWISGATNSIKASNNQHCSPPQQQQQRSPIVPPPSHPPTSSPPSHPPHSSRLADAHCHNPYPSGNYKDNAEVERNDVPTNARVGRRKRIRRWDVKPDGHVSPLRSEPSNASKRKKKPPLQDISNVAPAQSNHLKSAPAPKVCAPANPPRVQSNRLRPNVQQPVMKVPHGTSIPPPVQHKKCLGIQRYPHPPPPPPPACLPTRQRCPGPPPPPPPPVAACEPKATAPPLQEKQPPPPPPPPVATCPSACQPRASAPPPQQKRPPPPPPVATCPSARQPRASAPPPQQKQPPPPPPPPPVATCPSARQPRVPAPPPQQKQQKSLPPPPVATCPSAPQTRVPAPPPQQKQQKLQHRPPPSPPHRASARLFSSIHQPTAFPPPVGQTVHAPPPPPPPPPTPPPPPAGAPPFSATHARTAVPPPVRQTAYPPPPPPPPRAARHAMCGPASSAAHQTTTTTATAPSLAPSGSLRPRSGAGPPRKSSESAVTLPTKSASTRRPDPPGASPGPHIRGGANETQTVVPTPGGRNEGTVPDDESVSDGGSVASSSDGGNKDRGNAIPGGGNEDHPLPDDEDSDEDSNHPLPDDEDSDRPLPDDEDVATFPNDEDEDGGDAIPFGGNEDPSDEDPSDEDPSDEDTTTDEGTISDVETDHGGSEDSIRGDEWRIPNDGGDERAIPYDPIPDAGNQGTPSAIELMLGPTERLNDIRFMCEMPNSRLHRHLAELLGITDPIVTSIHENKLYLITQHRFVSQNPRLCQGLQELFRAHNAIGFDPWLRGEIGWRYYEDPVHKRAWTKDLVIVLNSLQGVFKIFAPPSMRYYPRTKAYTWKKNCNLQDCVFGVRKWLETMHCSDLANELLRDSQYDPTAPVDWAKYHPESSQCPLVTVTIDMMKHLVNQITKIMRHEFGRELNEPLGTKWKNSKKRQTEFAPTTCVQWNEGTLEAILNGSRSF